MVKKQKKTHKTPQKNRVFYIFFFFWGGGCFFFSGGFFVANPDKYAASS